MLPQAYQMSPQGKDCKLIEWVETSNLLDCMELRTARLTVVPE